MKHVSRFGLSALALLASAPAFAQTAPTSPIDTLFAGIDLSAVATTVTTLGVTVVGIVLAFKGIEIAKRAINKV